MLLLNCARCRVHCRRSWWSLLLTRLPSIDFGDHCPHRLRREVVLSEVTAASESPAQMPPDGRHSSTFSGDMAQAKSTFRAIGPRSVFVCSIALFQDMLSSVLGQLRGSRPSCANARVKSTSVEFRHFVHGSSTLLAMNCHRLQSIQPCPDRTQR